MKALICGSFDPVTNGHTELIKRAARMFDEIIVGIFLNTEKKYMFSEKQRLSMLCGAISEIKNARAELCSGLVAKYAQDNNIGVIVKGIRNTADYEYELNMAKINKKLCPDTETVFLPADPENDYISSSMVRIFIQNGENIEPYVPKSVIEELNRTS